MNKYAKRFSLGVLACAIVWAGLGAWRYVQDYRQEKALEELDQMLASQPVTPPISGWRNIRGEGVPRFRKVLLPFVDKRDVVELNLANYALTKETFLKLADIRLGSLRLFRSTFANADLRYLGSQDHIHELCFSSSPIDDGGLSSVMRYRTLTALLLDNTAITDSGLKHVRTLRALQILWLSETKVSDSGLRELSGLPDLRHLELQRSLVTDAGMQYIGQLKRLQILLLADTRISDRGISQLAGLSHLTILSLRNTKITDDALPYLMKLTSLETVGVKGTLLTEEGVGRWAVDNPRLRIQR